MCYPKGLVPVPGAYPRWNPKYCPLWTFGRWSFAILLHQEQCLSSTIGPSLKKGTARPSNSARLGVHLRQSKFPFPMFWASEGHQKWRQKKQQAQRTGLCSRVQGTRAIAPSASTGKGQTKAGCCKCLDRQALIWRVRALARSAVLETSVLPLPPHQVLWVFDGQHPTLPGEITLSQAGHDGRVGWDGMGWDGWMDGWMVWCPLLLRSIRERRDT